MNQKRLTTFIIILTTLFLSNLLLTNEKSLAQENFKVYAWYKYSEVDVSGKPKQMNSFIINNQNYIKLDELQYLLNDSGKNFEYYGSNKSDIIKLKPTNKILQIYKQNLDTNYNTYRNNTKNIEPLFELKNFIIGKNKHTLDSFNIDGENYYRLVDILRMLKIDVKWNNKLRKVIISPNIKSKKTKNSASKQIKKQKVAVLMYHHILKEKDQKKYFNKNGSVLSKEMFEKHMNFIKNSGYNTITAKQLEDFIYKKKPLPKSKNNTSILITFDDGYLSNYLYAYPIMKKLDMKAVCFHVTTNIAKQEITKLNPKILERFSFLQMDKSKDVFEHASHSHEFHSMTANKVPYYLAATDSQVKQDLDKSRHLVGGSKYFAYPYGAYNKRLINMLKSSGYKLAFTTKKGYTHDYDNPYKLNRYPIFPTTTVNNLKNFLENAR